MFNMRVFLSSMNKDDVVTTRRLMLQKWIDDNFQDPYKQSKFIKDLEERNPDTPINQGEIASLLKNKSFGEKKARKLEALAGMPKDYLDNKISRIVKRMVDPDSLARILLDIYSKLDDAGKHKLLVKANELIILQTSEVKTILNPYPIKPKNKLPQ